MIRMGCLLIGKRGGRTVGVQVRKLNSIQYVVASKGFQKLTLHFLLSSLLLFLLSIIIVLMSLSLFVCMPLLLMFACFWLNQWKLCMSMVHSNVSGCLSFQSELSGLDMMDAAALGH